MRFVVVTNLEDPFAATFWQGYHAAQGLPPATVFFLEDRRPRPMVRKVTEALLLFGPAASVRSWRLSRQAGQTLREQPQRMFPGTTDYRYLSTLNEGKGLQALQQQPPDLLASVGSPQIFKQAVLRSARLGAVNVHNGRLPRYRGLFGTFWEMLHGEPWGYASIHKMEKKVDSGVVLAQGAVRLDGQPLFEVLEAKKRQGGMLLAWLVRFVAREGRLPPACPYNADLASGYYPWPSLTQIAAFRMRRLQGPGSRSTAISAPAAWPAEVGRPETPGESAAVEAARR